MPKNTCKPWKGPPKKRSLTYRFLYHFRVKGSRRIVGIGLPRGDMRARIARVGRPPRYDPKSCELGLSGCGIFHRVRFGPHSDKFIRSRRRGSNLLYLNNVSQTAIWLELPHCCIRSGYGRSNPPSVQRRLCSRDFGGNVPPLQLQCANAIR